MLTFIVKFQMLTMQDYKHLRTLHLVEMLQLRSPAATTLVGTTQLKHYKQDTNLSRY